MGELSEALRAAVKASGQTPYSIAKGADINRSQLSRLLSGERGLNSETMERLAEYLGLEIVVRPKTSTTKKK